MVLSRAGARAADRMQLDHHQPAWIENIVHIYQHESKMMLTSTRSLVSTPVVAQRKNVQVSSRTMVQVRILNHELVKG